MILTPTLASQLLWFYFFGNLSHGNPQHRSKESEPNACRDFHCTRSGASGGGGGSGAATGCGGKIGNGRSSSRSVYSANNWAIVRCLRTKINWCHINWVRKWNSPELHCRRSPLRQPGMLQRCPLGHWYCRPYPFRNARPVIYILVEFFKNVIWSGSPACRKTK